MPADGLSNSGLSREDEFYLRRAIELAAEARAAGRHPFGSLIVNAAGRVMVESRNNAVRPAGEPTQHAEMLACSAAGKLFSEQELAGSTLFTEKGLLRYTRSHAENPTLDLPCREVFARGQRKVVVEGPFLEEEAGKVHEGFWSGS